MGLLKVTAPPARNYGNEISAILGQYGNTSAAQWQNAQQYDPQYQALALDLYSQAAPTINSILNANNSATRSATAGDLSTLGAGFTNTLRGINPSQTGLYDKLVTQANEGLDAGSRLTPDQAYSVTNPVRADWAGRGFSANALPGQLESAVNLARAGDNVQQQRQAFAGNVVEMGNRYYTLPTISSILGTGSNAAGVMGQFDNGSGQDSLAGLMGYGSDLFNTNYNAEAAAKIATANNRMAMLTTAMNGANQQLSNATSY